MSASELAALIKANLENVLDIDDSGNEVGLPMFISIDEIDGEPGSLGVEAADGSRFFVVVEDL